MNTRLSGFDAVYQYSKNNPDFLWDEILLPMLISFQSDWLIWLLAILCFVLLFIVCVCLKDLRSLWSEVLRLREKLANRTSKVDESSQVANTKETASIIHEIKQPISAITMLADLALDEMKEGNAKKHNPEIHEQLQQISTQGHRCSRIIEKMRSSTIANKGTFKPTHINQIINRAIEEIQYYDGYNKITIRRKLQENLPPIEADSEAIHQVLTNLIRNAIDAMEKSDPKELTVISHNSKGGIHVEVSDTGKGLETKSTDSIYNSFYTTKGKQGVGLGLSISKSIIENHNGTISVSSEGDKGTTFSIYLPIF